MIIETTRKGRHARATIYSFRSFRFTIRFGIGIGDADGVSEPFLVQKVIEGPCYRFSYRVDEKAMIRRAGCELKGLGIRPSCSA